MAEETSSKKRIPFKLSEEDLEKIKKQFREMSLTNKKIEEILAAKRQREKAESSE